MNSNHKGDNVEQSSAAGSWSHWFLTSNYISRFSRMSDNFPISSTDRIGSLSNITAFMNFYNGFRNNIISKTTWVFHISVFSIKRTFSWFFSWSGCNHRIIPRFMNQSGRVDRYHLPWTCFIFTADNRLTSHYVRITFNFTSSFQVILSRSVKWQEIAQNLTKFIMKASQDFSKTV